LLNDVKKEINDNVDRMCRKGPVQLPGEWGKLRKQES
jgi:hypothetical protein